MVFLVTGARGFIGSWMVERLLAAQATVRCLTRRDAELHWLKGRPIEVWPASLFEPEALRRVLRDVDYVLHFAGLTRALHARDYFRVNADGTRCLLDAVRAAAPRIRRVVHISSQAAAGPAPTSTPLDESSPAHPITDYGKSKLASEEIARSFAADLPITILRPPVVFGPRDTSGFALFKAAAHRYRIAIRGCDPLFSPIFVQDLTEAVYRAAVSQRSAGETYFVSGAETLLASQFIEALAAASGSTPRDITLPYWAAWLAVGALEIRAQIIGRPNKLNYAKLKEVQQSYWLASNTKIKRDLEFSPQTALRDAVQETLQWYRHVGWL